MNEKEIQIISDIAKYHELSAKDVSYILNENTKFDFTLPKTFTDRLSLLYDAVLLMVVDLNIHQNEKAICIDLAKKLYKIQYCDALAHNPDKLEKRKENWKKLYDRLKCVEDKLILPEPAPGSDPSWFGFLISVRPESGLSRNAVTRKLEEHNIQTRLLFSGNIILHPCFDDIRGTGAYRVAGSLENTDTIMENSFWIGVYPGMTDEMIDYMVKMIKEVLA